MKSETFLICTLFGAMIFFNQSAAAQKKPIKKQTKNGAVKTSTANGSANVNGEPLPHKVNDDTAISPVYSINSKNCRNKDDYATEGEDFYRECKAWGDYLLRASGFGYRVNYGIVSKNAPDFLLMLFPLAGGEAAKYERADLYDQKLGDEIEWQLDEQGKAFAVIVRAAIYKNTGSAKTFQNPKNKRAEFYFVRGLKNFEDLAEDVPTAKTAFNPLEQARHIAAEYYENHKNNRIGNE